MKFRKSPKQLTKQQMGVLAELKSDRVVELYEAQFNGTLGHKLFYGLLYKERVKAKARRTTNPAASEMFDASLNRKVKIANRSRMRRIEVRIMALTHLAVSGSMDAAEMLMDMWVRSKCEGDFVLEEEFDRYPAN